MKSKRNALKIDSDILEAIGKRIIEIRKRLRLNQKEFAASIDDIRWLMEHSPMSKNIIIGYCNQFLYENEKIIKKNIKRCRGKKDKMDENDIG